MALLAGIQTDVTGNQQALLSVFSLLIASAVDFINIIASIHHFNLIFTLLLLLYKLIVDMSLSFEDVQYNIMTLFIHLTRCCQGDDD